MPSNYLQLFSAYVGNLKISANGEAYGLCPFHDDKVKSFGVNMNTGLWICHAGCGQGNAYQFCEKLGLNPAPYKSNGGNKIPSEPKPEPRKESKLSLQDEIKGVNFHKCLVTNFDDLKDSGKIPACWSLKTIKDLQIGFDRTKNCITFLYFNKKYELVNIKCHKQKSIPGHGRCTLYPAQALDEIYSKDKLIIFCEGEKDVVTLLSLGFQAVTSTTGAGSIPRDLSPLRGYKKIIIAYDRDEAGKTGTVKLTQHLRTDFPKMIIAIHHWTDDRPSGYDITDYFSSGGNKEDFEKLLRKAESFEITESVEQHSNIIQFEGQFIDEILSNTEHDPVPIISKGLLDPNSILLISGAPKTGKSILATNLALSLIAGRNWFDFEIPEPMNVFYFQAEMKEYRIRKRIKTMMKSKGLKHIGEFFITEPSGFDILNDDYFKSLQRFIIENKTNVLVFDPLISYHNSDENSNNEMQRVMERFRTFVNLNNVSLILVHHTRKFTSAAGGQNARGASAIFGALDGLVEMRKSNENIKLHFDLRYDSAPDEMALKLNPSTLWFEKVDKNLRQDSDKRIMEILGNSSTGMSKSDLTKKLSSEFGKSENSTRSWINKLVKNGVVSTDGSKRNPLLFIANKKV